MKAMANTKRDRENAAELELIAALKRTPAKDGPQEICPSPVLLRRFVAGLIDDEKQRTDILTHMDICSRCMRTVVEFHKNRRVHRRSILGLVAALLLATAVWIWPSRPHSAAVAVVDLIATAPTRSNPQIDMSPIKISSDTRQFRIFLPQLSDEGRYEVALFTRQRENPPVLHGFASTRRQDHLELVIDMDFERIRPGQYLLALRHGDSDWMYIPVVNQ
jgi:hypothetical protein